MKPAPRGGYHGIRVTLASDGRGTGFLAISVKTHTTRWDDWDQVDVATRIDLSSATSTVEALRVLSAALWERAQQLDV